MGPAAEVPVGLCAVGGGTAGKVAQGKPPRPAALGLEKSDEMHVPRAVVGSYG